jgi:outer membrane protein
MSENKAFPINLVLNIILLIAVIVLFVLYFTGANQKSSSNVSQTGIPERDSSFKAVMPENFSVAYVNTDTLMEHYEFYKEATKKIEVYEVQLKNQYESRAKKLQADYEQYVSQGKAGLLTLNQQKETEARLTSQQEDLMNYEKSISQESMMKRQEISGQVTDTIISFLNRLRLEMNYTLILQYGSMSGLLSASPDLDITDQVIDRLNAKYNFEKNH